MRYVLSVLAASFILILFFSSSYAESYKYCLYHNCVKPMVSDIKSKFKPGDFSKYNFYENCKKYDKNPGACKTPFSNKEMKGFASKKKLIMSNFYYCQKKCIEKYDNKK